MYALMCLCCVCVCVRRSVRPSVCLCLSVSLFKRSYRLNLMFLQNLFVIYVYNKSKATSMFAEMSWLIFFFFFFFYSWIVIHALQIY